MIDNLTWKCDMCGKEREDKYIDVMSYKIKDFPGAIRNIKYCNDDPGCAIKAQRKSETREI